MNPNIFPPAKLLLFRKTFISFAGDNCVEIENFIPAGNLSVLLWCIAFEEKKSNERKQKVSIAASINSVFRNENTYLPKVFNEQGKLA